jgi:hypothetical protein
MCPENPFTRYLTFFSFEEEANLSLMAWTHMSVQSVALVISSGELALFHLL